MAPGRSAVEVCLQGVLPAVAEVGTVLLADVVLGEPQRVRDAVRKLQVPAPGLREVRPVAARDVGLRYVVLAPDGEVAEGAAPTSSGRTASE
eukprot:9705925-Alexandrium_andersonii.AAC.1